MRTVHEIEQALYEMAPRELAFGWDNVGLHKFFFAQTAKRAQTHQLRIAEAVVVGTPAVGAGNIEILFSVNLENARDLGMKGCVRVIAGVRISENGERTVVFVGNSHLGGVGEISERAAGNEVVLSVPLKVRRCFANKRSSLGMGKMRGIYAAYVGVVIG